MIAVWMLYCLGIGLAFVVVGYALERALQWAGQPTRWAWVLALVGSFAVPIGAWLQPEAFATFAAPIPVVELTGAPSSSGASDVLARPPKPRFSVSDLDGILRWGWAASSLLMTILLTVAATRLLRLRRDWRHVAVDGRLVLVSRNLGPAVVGLWSPAVVLPEWALELPTADRELMLAHEEQHIRAADPLLLAGAFLTLLLAPWNLALWIQCRRLHLAVEMDCDARVLARGRSAPAYGELLVRVGRRRTAQLTGAAAFGEPVSFLEARIRRMLATLPRARWLGVVGAMVLATGAMLGACEMPRPVAPAGPAPASPGQIAQRVDSVMAEQRRSWVATSVRRFFPALLEETQGPAVDLWLMHDSRWRVSQAVAAPRTQERIRSEDINAVFKSFRSGRDAWGTIPGGLLRGLLRDNVRVIWVHHDPATRDLSALDAHPEMRVLPWIRQGIATHYPALARDRGGAPVELWFVADPRKRVLRTVQRPGAESIHVGIDEIRTVFPTLSEASVASWSVTPPNALRGVVRGTAYVIWIQLREGASLH